MLRAPQYFQEGCHMLVPVFFVLGYQCIYPMTSIFDILRVQTRVYRPTLFQLIFRGFVVIIGEYTDKSRSRVTHTKRSCTFSFERLLKPRTLRTMVWLAIFGAWIQTT